MQKVTVLKRLLIGLSLFLIYSQLWAQGELSPDVRVMTTNEHSFLLAMNSNGTMFSFQRGKRLDGFRKRTIDFDFAYVKHPKEIRVENPYYQNQKKFVFGKLYTMFALRAGIGKQREIYSIFDKGGVAIRYHYEFGASLALMKPNYYEVVDSSRIVDNIEYIYLSDKQFDYNIHRISDIYSRSSFFKGVDETKLIPGGFVKAGLSFVFSEKQEAVNALEVGAILDIFAKPVQIMATDNKDRFLVSLYIGYRFGKIKVKNRDSDQLMNDDDETSD